MAMKTTAESLKEKGKVEFAKLFDRIFPDGADLSEYKSYKDFIKDIEKRAHLFKRHFKKYVFICEKCNKYFSVYDYQIATCLMNHKAMPCMYCFEKEMEFLSLITNINFDINN